MAIDSARTYPSDMPVLALRDTVVLPLTVQPLAISRPASVEAVNRALAGDRLVFMTLQTVDAEEPQPNDLKTIGTIGAIRQMAKVPNGVEIAPGRVPWRMSLGCNAPPAKRVRRLRR